MECIVLAGGLGTRLQGVIGEVPKCMAPVNGKPFLHYLCRYLEQQGCSRLLLSLGFRHEAVLDWVNSRAFMFPVAWSIEREPLGTGGGIRKALMQATDEHVCVLNGDTLFQASLPELMQAHRQSGAAATLALKPMQNFDRYGTVRINEAGRITAFEEKKAREEGLINGGIYIIKREAFLSTPQPPKFSFEQDYLEKEVDRQYLGGVVQDAYFIDIGIPEDYERAQTDFQKLFGS